MTAPADLRVDARRLATCDGPGQGEAALGLHADWSVAVRDGRIEYLGPTADAPPAIEVHEVDCAMPGLVDPHTHLVFAGSRADEFARRMAGVDYHTIAAEGGGIASTVRATRAATDEALFALALGRVRRLAEGGVTAVEVKSGYGLDVETELRLLRVARRLDREGPIRVTTSFLGAHALPPGARDRAGYVDEVVGEQLPRVVEEGLADAIDVYCDEGAFSLAEAERVLRAGRDAGLAVRAHVGQFADLGGPALLAELGALSGDHLEQVSDAGRAAMAEAGVVAVLLPGAWRTLRQEPPSAPAFREAGVAMAIGTDLNPGTSPTADLPLQVALAVRDAGCTAEEAVLGVTREAARAAGFEGAGRLYVGGPADLAGFALTDPRGLAYTFGGVRATLTIARGRPVQVAPAPRLW